MERANILEVRKNQKVVTYFKEKRINYVFIYISIIFFVVNVILKKIYFILDKFYIS